MGISNRKIVKFFFKAMLIYFINLFLYNYRAENVAEAIVKMINVGKSGDVWVSEDNKPPYAIPDLTPYKERGVAV